MLSLTISLSVYLEHEVHLGGVADFPQVEAVLAHGLEAGLTVVEEAAVPGHEDDQGAVLRLGLTALDLSLEVAASLQRNGLGDILTSLRVNAGHLNIALHDNRFNGIIETLQRNEHVRRMSQVSVRQHQQSK